MQILEYWVVPFFFFFWKENKTLQSKHIIASFFSFSFISSKELLTYPFSSQRTGEVKLFLQ